MKHFYSLALIVLVLFVGVSCQKKTCKDFKVGTFQAPDKSINDIVISRTETTQTEFSEERGFKDEYSITWLNDCEYYLVLLKSNNPDKNLLINKDTLRVSITGIEDDLYQYTAFLKGKQFVGDLKQISINPK
ncbi:MAG: hypothetical protein ACPGEG_05985 [Salibacteraceae bacterium]